MAQLHLEAKPTLISESQLQELTPPAIEDQVAAIYHDLQLYAEKMGFTDSVCPERA